MKVPSLMMRALVVALVLVAQTVSPASPPRTAGAAPVSADAPAPAARYRLDASVDLGAGNALVSQSIQYRNVVGVPLTSLVFRVPATAVGAFALEAASVDGQLVTPHLDGSVLELPLAQALAPGGAANAEIQFRLTIPEAPGRLARTGRGVALGYWFPLLAVHRGEWDRRQFVDVGDATFSEVADFDLSITTSTPATIVATGERVEDGASRARFVARSVRDAAVAISPQYIVRRVQVGASTLEVAAFSAERADYYATRGAEFLAWANTKFGAYPYPTLVVAEADLPSSYGGLEYPGLIFLARGIPLASQPAGSSLDTLYLHEILHQWFYSLVGNDQIADPWLDEAFVTYLAYAFYREREPALAASVYDRTISGSQTAPVNSSVYDFPSDTVYFSVVYRRGARFLEALHDRLGDAVFWRLLRDYVDTHRDRIATPRAFLERAQTLAPSSIRPLIRQYFTYGAFQSDQPPVWSVQAQESPWSGDATVFVAAEFPVSRVEVWLDSRRLADGPSNNLTLDLSGVEDASYVLLVRAFDQQDVAFERTRRVEVRR